jgi:hypothetical protein
MARPDDTKVWRDIDHNKHEEESDYINNSWGKWKFDGKDWNPTKNLEEVKTFIKNFIPTLMRADTPAASAEDFMKDLFEGKLKFSNDGQPFEPITDIRGLQQYLKNVAGYSNLADDNMAGAQTMNALVDFIRRQYSGNQDTVSHENSGHPTLAYGNIPAATTLGKISITPKTWENNKTLTPSAEGPTWNRKQIRNFGDFANVNNSTISSINNTVNPYGLKFNSDKLTGLYAAVGNVGTRGGWDRARERALANRAYTITKGLDGKYFLKFNENRLNNKANNSYGYDISSLITSNQPT